jgi:hypothetical protein
MPHYNMDVCGCLAPLVAMTRRLGEPDFAPSPSFPSSPSRLGSRKLRRTDREATSGEPGGYAGQAALARPPREFYRPNRVKTGGSRERSQRD